MPETLVYLRSRSIPLRGGYTDLAVQAIVFDRPLDGSPGLESSDDSFRSLAASKVSGVADMANVPPPSGGPPPLE